MTPHLVEVTEEQRSLIESHDSVIVQGRSGTGKMLCCVYWMLHHWAKYHQYNRSGWRS